MSAELIRGRWHPGLHPVLRVGYEFREPRCQAEGPVFDDEGEEFVRTCERTAGHTGRHFEWEWEASPGRGQIVHVWTDAECHGIVRSDHGLPWEQQSQGGVQS